MRLGTGIVLIAIGAILAFAVHFQLSGIDIRIVGWILMVVGVIGVLLELAVWAPRRRRVVQTDGYSGAPVRRTTDETY
jgi:hypothetical protein